MIPAATGQGSCKTSRSARVGPDAEFRTHGFTVRDYTPPRSEERLTDAPLHGEQCRADLRRPESALAQMIALRGAETVIVGIQPDVARDGAARPDAEWRGSRTGPRGRTGVSR
jgi:hypothetical protein